MSKPTARQFFEHVYADEMQIPKGHVFGEPGEINFEDPTIREAAYAGFALAYSIVQDTAYRMTHSVQTLRARIQAETTPVLRALEDDRAVLGNFAAQINMHDARKEGDVIPLPDVFDLTHLENTVEGKLKFEQRLLAPRANKRMRPISLQETPAFSVAYALEFDKYYPIAYRYQDLVLANGIGPAKEEYQQNVFVVLAIKGEPELMALTYAENLRAAFHRLRTFRAACINICPVGEIRALGSSLEGGPIEALVLTLNIHHHEFMKAQKYSEKQDA